MSFDSLGLSADLLRAVRDQGYTTATPIQQQAIPAALAGTDLMASAQTGTGKTAAFTLPLLQRLAGSAGTGRRKVRALVLTPTRELAVQVNDSVRDYGRHLPLRSTPIFGGVPIRGQMRDLSRGMDILVATPGRLMDHMERGTIDLSDVELLVMDEADRMLDMGFLPAIEKIAKAVPASRQTLLFSATFSQAITKLARRFLRDPQVVETATPNAAATDVDQTAYKVDGHRKRELLTHLVSAEDWGQLLVFTRTKRGADRLAKQLEQDGIRSTAIHGDKSQGARNKALTEFKRNRVQALIATDVAARGIDIDDLPYVVNYDIPTNPEDYVHRIGRTGRRGQSGSAVSLIGADEHAPFAGIRRLIGFDIPAQVRDGFEPTEKPAPARKPGGKGRGGPPRGRPGQGAPRSAGSGRPGGGNRGGPRRSAG